MDPFFMGVVVGVVAGRVLGILAAVLATPWPTRTTVRRPTPAEIDEVTRAATAILIAAAAGDDCAAE